jgi:hypothetical protein
MSFGINRHRSRADLPTVTQYDIFSVVAELSQSFLQISANVNEVSVHENRPTIILISPYVGESYVGGLADEGVFHYTKESSILGQCRPMQAVPRLEPDQTALISFFQWCIQHLKALCSN